MQYYDMRLSIMSKTISTHINYAQDEQLVQALGNAIYQGFNIKAESEDKE